MHYLPLSPLFFAVLAGALVLLVALIELRVLRYAYLSVGLSPRAAMLLLLASLLGSYINIPLFHVGGGHMMTGRVVRYFGMPYIVPTVVNAPDTIVAVNLGGAIIPAALSLYLLFGRGLWLKGVIATFIVAVVCYRLAEPLPGVGIALPTFVPPVVAAIVACLVSWREAAPLAYIAGSMGTLIGADLMNLGRIQGLGAPVASIGGAGTFDGIFLTGVLAVLIASVFGGPARKSA